MPENQTRRIIVVGGGMAGLAAAYRLGEARRAGAALDECLLEAGDRLGGVVRTEHIDGCVVEAGPDSFLSEKPEAAALARELGLGDALLGSNDAVRRTYILHRGRLEPLPDGFLLMVPTRIWPAATTPLVPISGKLTIAQEWLTGRAPGGPVPAGDESVASFIRRHFGAGVLENIAEPLLAGVYGGDAAGLSVRSVFARFRAMEQKHGSLVRAALAARARMGAAGAPPIFMTLRDGLGSLAEALASRIEGERVQLRRRVVRIEAALASEAGNRRYRIFCADGSSYEADSVIIALPAWAGSALLDRLDGELAEELAHIPYNSALTVALGYGGHVRRRLPRGFGFLVPRAARRRLLACTFVHTKFNHRAPIERALLRCFLGGSRDPEILDAGDEEIVRTVREELGSILGLREEPLFSRVHRWPRAMAQYVVGHAERVQAIAERLRGHPGLFLAGNAFSGIGVPDVIRTGEAAAREALKYLEPAAAEEVVAR
ncbi:MAG TPA: protoporphyrinogen oxidase [Terriglobia bacterium]|nr:protoporphyrinogen oxidase [Terriglobia bacterium]